MDFWIFFKVHAHIPWDCECFIKALHMHIFSDCIMGWLCILRQSWVEQAFFITCGRWAPSFRWFLEWHNVTAGLALEMTSCHQHDVNACFIPPFIGLQGGAVATSRWSPAMARDLATQIAVYSNLGARSTTVPWACPHFLFQGTVLYIRYLTCCNCQEQLY